MKWKKLISCLIMFMMIICSVTGVSASTINDLSKKRPDDNNIYPSFKEDAFYYLEWNSFIDNGDVSIYKSDLTGKQEKLREIHRYYSDYYYRDDTFYYMGAYDKKKMPVYKLDLINNKIEKLFDYQTEYYPTAMGVDASGQIYLAKGKSLEIYDMKGSKLAEKNIDDTIDEFYGFDSTNGNFYVKGSTEWQNFGYTYDMVCLKVGNYSDHTINYNKKSVILLHQDRYYSHDGCVEMLNDQYLGALVPYTGEQLYILDSHKIKYDDVIDSVTLIDPVTNGTLMTSVCLGDKTTRKLTVQAKEGTYGYGHDQSGVGSLAVYYRPRKSFFIVTDKNKITEYDDSDKQTNSIETTHEVYKLMIVKDKIMAIERDGVNFFIETFDSSLPTSLTLTGTKKLSVGGHAKYDVKFDGDMKPNYTLTSSDSSILSIDDDGYAETWKTGTVKITAATSGGLKSSIDVTVSAIATPTYTSVLPLNGKISNNLYQNNYSTWSKVVNSYLTETSKGLLRIENIDGTLQAEYYNAAGKVTSSLTISKELTDFAGFYAGKDYYYVAFKQDNTNESDNQEVLRIVKYDQSWKRLAATSIKGANTYIPVSAGSLRMTEDNGILYIHTCHQMYQSNDGLNHQANMTFAINESDMSVKDSYTDIMNMSTGYVSHSFNQFIKVDNGKIYRVDHGDGYPRGIAYTVTDESKKISDPSIYKTVVSIEGTIGVNYTGVSVGGFELSATNALIAYNQDGTTSSRNIKLVSFKKDDDGTVGEDNIIQVTNYSKNDQVTCLTPQLVKIDDYHFILMWQEMNTTTEKLTAKFVQLDHLGRKVSDIVEKNVPLSDVQPIVTSDGLITWYVSYDDKIKLYKLNPYNLNALSDDEDFDTEKKKEETQKAEKDTKTNTSTDKKQTTNSTKTTEQSSSSTNKEETPKAANTDTAATNAGTPVVKTDQQQAESNLGLTNNNSSTVTKKQTAKNTATTSVKTNSMSKLIQKYEKQMVNKKDNDIKNSTFAPMKLTFMKADKKSIKIRWTKIAKAKGYMIYGNKCGKKYKYLKTVRSTSATFKKLRKGTYYKYLVIAYDKKYQALSISKTIHVSTAGGKSGNYKSVKLKSPQTIKLKKGKSAKIQAQAIVANKKKKVKKHVPLRYESSSKKIVTVTAKGKLKAKKKGKCIVYVYDQNGHFKKINVTVKK